MNCEIRYCPNPATKEVREALTHAEAITPLEKGGIKIKCDPKKNVCDEHYKEVLENYPKYYSIEN
jgi:hypothetical protein